MSAFAFSPSGWTASAPPASVTSYPLLAESDASTMPSTYCQLESFDLAGSSSSSSSGSYFTVDAPLSSSPSAGSSSASSSSPAPATPVKDLLPSPLCHGSDATPTAAAAAPLGSGWVSATPFLPASASVAERCNETGYFLTLSSEVDKKLRTVQACDACRSRKAKCDGLKDSCTRCIQRGVACAYTTGPRRPVKAPKRPSITSTRSGSVSSASSGSLPLASHVKLQSVTSAADKARKPSKVARHGSSSSVAEPRIVDPSSVQSDDAYDGELAFGWSSDGLAAPFEIPYAPVQPPAHTQYYPTVDARPAPHYRRSSLQHVPSPYAAPYPRQRSASHQVSSSTGFFDGAQPSVFTPRNPSVLVQRRKSAHPTCATPTRQQAPYPSPDVADDDFFHPRPTSANVYQTPIVPRRSSAPQVALPTPYTPVYAPSHDLAFEPFSQHEAQSMDYEPEPAWVESQALWGEVVY